jgi:hypothetical protein
MIVNFISWPGEKTQRHVWNAFLDYGSIDWQKTLTDLEKAPDVAYGDVLEGFDKVWCVITWYPVDPWLGKPPEWFVIVYLFAIQSLQFVPYIIIIFIIYYFMFYYLYNTKTLELDFHA